MKNIKENIRKCVYNVNIRKLAEFILYIYNFVFFSHKFISCVFSSAFKSFVFILSKFPCV